MSNTPATRINLNHKVFFRPTEQLRSILEHGRTVGLLGDYVPDSNGWYSEQLHVLFRDFGKYLVPGQPAIFEDNVIVTDGVPKVVEVSENAVADFRKDDLALQVHIRHMAVDAIATQMTSERSIYKGAMRHDTPIPRARITLECDVLSVTTPPVGGKSGGV